MGEIVLGHRRVYILPTRLGWMFGATLGILLVGSINYALQLGFALTFLLAGMGLAGMVHTTRNLARLAVSAGRAEPVFAGEAAQFRLYLENRSPRRACAAGSTAMAHPNAAPSPSASAAYTSCRRAWAGCTARRSASCWSARSTTRCSWASR